MANYGEERSARERREPAQDLETLEELYLATGNGVSRQVKKAIRYELASTPQWVRAKQESRFQWRWLEWVVGAHPFFDEVRRRQQEDAPPGVSCQLCGGEAHLQWDSDHRPWPFCSHACSVQLRDFYQ